MAATYGVWAAIKANDKKDMEREFSNGANPDDFIDNNDLYDKGLTALMVAMRRKSFDAAEVLLKNGASLFSKVSSSGKNAFDHLRSEAAYGDSNGLAAKFLKRLTNDLESGVDGSQTRAVVLRVGHGIVCVALENGEREFIRLAERGLFGSGSLSLMSVAARGCPGLEVERVWKLDCDGKRDDGRG